MKLQEELKRGREQKLRKWNWGDFFRNSRRKIILALSWRFVWPLVTMIIISLILLIELYALVISLQIFRGFPIFLFHNLLINTTINNKLLKLPHPNNYLSQWILQKVMKMIPYIILGTAITKAFLFLYDFLQIIKEMLFSLSNCLPSCMG